MNESLAAQRNKLVDDLRTVIHDAEALLKSGSEQLGDGASHWSSETQNKLQNLQNRLSDIQHSTTERLRQVTRNTQAYVQENPWKAISIASGLALIAGYFLNRR